jgi:type I restriction enzyme S subunit
MNDWRPVKLGDVADLCLGKMLDAKKNRGQPYPYLSNPDVRWFDVDASRLKNMLFESSELDRFGLCAGDVLVCEGGEAGRAAVWDGRRPDVKFQKAIHRVRPGPNLFNRFLVHKLFADYYTGATIKHLTGQDLATYEISLPPVDEQLKIAEVLDRAEALRANRRAALALLDTLAKSIFFGLFGNESDRWPMRPVSDYVARFEGGKSFQADSDNNAKAVYRVLKISAVTSMEIIPSESKPVPDGYQPEREHLVRSGDLLFSRANTLDLVGAVAHVEAAPSNMLLPDKLWRFVWAEPRLVDPHFVWALFQSGPVRREIARRATGTSGSMKNISQEKLMGIQTMVPPLSLQKEFARRLASINGLKSAYRASLAQLDALFASLQHRAFRGEL